MLGSSVAACARFLLPLAMLLALAAWSVWAGPAFSQGPQQQGTAQKSSEGAALRKQIDESLARFTFTSSGEPEAPLQLKAVLRWDNNARASQVGATVMFVGGGRPEAVCCVYPYFGKLHFEFSSMSRGTFQAELDGRPFWQPAGPGLEFRAIPSSAEPAGGPSRRLLQMKRLARRFEAELLGWKDDDSQREDLRLLTNPIFRYEKPARPLVDGAVFAFVTGVDPEALLMIEAVASESGPPAWQYGFVRRTSGQLEGRLDGTTVWTAKRYPPNSDPSGQDIGYVEPIKGGDGR